MKKHLASSITLPDVDTRTKKRTKTIRIPQYHVVLFDDNEHTYDYVVEMLVQLFRHSHPKAFEMACEVDSMGRVIVDTTTKERAELKREQVRAFGRDWRIQYSSAGMAATIEPADGAC